MSMKTRILIFALFAAVLAGFKAAAQAPGLHRSEVSTLGKNSQVITNITKETFITAVWSPTNPACWTDGDGNKWKEIRTTNYIRGFVVDGIFGIATQAVQLAVGDYWAYSTTLTNAGGEATQYDYTTANTQLKKLYYTDSASRWTTQARMFDQWGPFYYFYSTSIAYDTASFNVTNSNGGTISLATTNIPSTVTVSTQLVDTVITIQTLDAAPHAGKFAPAAITNAITAPYRQWTGTITPIDGTATVAYAHGNMPVLVTDAPCVLTLDPTGYGTAGVSRVSLSYYTGTNSFTFATNIIKYAETPTVDTNGWNTLLIRRVSDGVWKGVGL